MPGIGWLEIHDPSVPRRIQQTAETMAASLDRDLFRRAIATTMRTPEARNPPAIHAREVASRATGWYRPRATPKAKAAVITTAGSFTGHVSAAPAFRCGRSAGIDQTC